MDTLFVETPPEVQEWLAHRQELGQDKKDEVWEGVYHAVPQEHGRNGMVAMQLAVILNAKALSAGLTPGGSFNLGTRDNFRVPDLGFHPDSTPALYYPTAALVIEILSPGDETFAKFDFYAGSGVDELWVVDPLEKSVRIWRLRCGAYAEAGRSDLLGLSASEVEQAVHWPKS